MTAKLEGKVALVSGSGRGIGRSVALKLASEGARLVVNDLDPDLGESIASEIRAGGGDAVAVNGSVTEAEFAPRFIAAAEGLGGIDIIVNNAGYTWDSTIQNTSDAQFQSMLDVHLVAPFRILRAAAGPIRKAARAEAAAGRRIHRKVVNISSIAGLFGNAGQAGYASGKAAITGLTRTLAKEWGRHAVNVNAVAFGLIDTRLTQPIAEEQATIAIGDNEVKVGIQAATLETWAKMIPLGRAGTTEEAAGAVYLLCSPESDYISGQVIVCGGGLLV
jgi:3-oxoacyl-[acyl-carrier protein] reductase